MKGVLLVSWLLLGAGCQQIAALGDPPPDRAETPDGEVPDAAPQGTSCKDILTRAPGSPNGLYRIDDGRDLMVYCDMTIDGGGWTAFYSAPNGNAHVPGHFELLAGHANADEDCPDPAQRCIRLLPSWATKSTELLATCGDAAVVFSLPDDGLDYLKNGNEHLWVPTTTPRAVGGNANVAFARDFWTGQPINPGNKGWILSKNDSPQETWTPHTFASGHDYDATWAYCNGVPTAGSADPPLVHLFYR